MSWTHVTYVIVERIQQTVAAEIDISITLSKSKLMAATVHFTSDNEPDGIENATHETFAK
jgi:hypothetical protein